MRIFVTAPNLPGNERKSRLTLVQCNCSTDLLLSICELYGVQPKWLIASLKLEMVNIRIVQGWPLEKYPLKQGSEIIVEILPQGIKPDMFEQSPSKSEAIEQSFYLEGKDKYSTAITQDQNISFITHTSAIGAKQSYWGKYFDDSLKEFLDAVREKSVQKVSNLLKQQPECNDEKLIEKIMQKKTQFLLNSIGECGRGALHWAVQEKDLDMVQFLLIKSADPNVVSSDNYTPLQQAINVGCLHIFQTLLAQPKIEINKLTNRGTALHLAIEQQKLNFAQKLIDQKADIKIENMCFKTVSDIIKQKNMKDLKIKDQNENIITETPYILKGGVNRIFGIITTRHRERTIYVNPYLNQLILLEKDQKVDEKLQLSKIQSVATVKSKRWTMKDDIFYFQIKSPSLELILSVQHSKLGLQWIEAISNCVKYCKSEKQKVKVPIDQQLIQVFDDTTNTVKLHKRKKPNPTSMPKKGNRISLFDINPTQSSQQVNIPFLDINKSQISTAASCARLSNNENLNMRTSLPSSEASVYQCTADDYEPSFFRDSELLGSILNQSMLKSSIGKSFGYEYENMGEEKAKQTVKFSDFQILRQLGVGSFGKVFLARHKKQEKLLALKVLNKKKLMSKKQLKYAVGEANILKKVLSPFIIKLHYSFQTPSNLYIALDYCPYGDLSQLLNQDEQLSQKSCQFYVAQIILAIEYLHKNKIIYRDLKPQNILIGTDGFIRLTDFNLSKENDFSKSFCGSPAYLSPEMLQKKGVGFEADIYGIGCVLYQMVVGEPPFFDEDLKVLYENIKMGRLKFPTNISNTLKNLLQGLLQKDIKKRIGVKSFDDIKKHPFFIGFDWKLLENVQMKLPLEIEQKMNDKKDDLQIIKECNFQDTDYENSGSMINRIKNFTFVQETK